MRLLDCIWLEIRRFMDVELPQWMISSDIFGICNIN